MTKRLSVTLIGMLFAFSGVAGAQERPNRSGAAIEKALTNYVRQMEQQRAEPGPPLKAVPRTDKAEATVIGGVAFVDGTDFLSDGTPFRIVVVHAKRSFDQDVFVVCLGSSFNNSCGRLARGRRVSFTADVLVVEDGESAGLALLVVKKLVL